MHDHKIYVFVTTWPQGQFLPPTPILTHPSNLKQTLQRFSSASPKEKKHAKFQIFSNSLIAGNPQRY